MTKVINLELAKRLAPYLENIETEYKMDENGNIYNDIQNELCDAFDSIHKYRKLHKTLTLEEAIEFLPKKIDGKLIFNRGIEISKYIDYFTFCSSSFEEKIKGWRNKYSDREAKIRIIFDEKNNWNIDYRFTLGDCDNSINTIIANSDGLKWELTSFYNKILNFGKTEDDYKEQKNLFIRFKNRKKYQGDGKTLLQAIEKMLEYLVDNNLLGTKN